MVSQNSSQDKRFCSVSFVLCLDTKYKLLGLITCDCETLVEIGEASTERTTMTALFTWASGWHFQIQSRCFCFLTDGSLGGINSNLHYKHLSHIYLDKHIPYQHEICCIYFSLKGQDKIRETFKFVLIQNQFDKI